MPRSKQTARKSTGGKAPRAQLPTGSAGSAGVRRTPVVVRAVGRPGAQVNLDHNHPITEIHVKLLNGKRVTSAFNLFHIVEDIYTFVNMSEPAYALMRYVLKTADDVRVIQKEKTLLEIGLLNKILTQVEETEEGDGDSEDEDEEDESEEHESPESSD